MNLSIPILPRAGLYKILEKIQGGYTPDIPFVNPKKIVTNAFLGSELRKGRMTPEQLDALNKSNAQAAYSYLSSNIRNAPLGDAGSYFHEKYNPWCTAQKELLRDRYRFGW